jgi:hypothetical protein
MEGVPGACRFMTQAVRIQVRDELNFEDLQ